MSDDTTIRDDVIELLRSVGFEVRDNDGIFAVNGTIDSGAQLIEALMERQQNFEKRGYRKGYSAGRKRKARVDSDEQRYKRNAAFLDRAYLALLPAAMQVQGWKINDTLVTKTSQRIELAKRWACEALKQRPLP